MKNAVSDLITAWMNTLDVPAISIAIIEKQEVVYRDGFGVLNDSPMQSRTILSAQSLTKPMVAYSALQLVLSGQLDLDVPLRHYLEKSYLSDDARVDRITARHALSHATGFANWRDLETGLEISFDPGTDYNYSGEGYCYLQTALEAITGDSLETLLKSLFDDLAMSDSTMAVFTEKMREHPFIAQFEHLNTNAAFSLMTSADDYAKFMLAMLDDSNQSIVDLMLTPQQGVAGKDGFYWGNGWGIEDTSSARYFWQWGAGMDERHLAIGSRDKQWGAVILTEGNNGTDKGLELAHKIAQQYDPEIGKWFDWLSE